MKDLNAICLECEKDLAAIDEMYIKGIHINLSKIKC